MAQMPLSYPSTNMKCGRHGRRGRAKLESDEGVRDGMLIEIFSVEEVYEGWMRVIFSVSTAVMARQRKGSGGVTWSINKGLDALTWSINRVVDGDATGWELEVDDDATGRQLEVDDDVMGRKSFV
ncbi:hypothetical protein QYF36_007127 [Acer negundo]|nr:hypothetical protein QYF36_007127 [Acer negundo]